MGNSIHQYKIQAIFPLALDGFIAVCKEQKMAIVRRKNGQYELAFLNDLGPEGTETPVAWTEVVKSNEAVRELLSAMTDWYFDAIEDEKS